MFCECLSIANEKKMRVLLILTFCVSLLLFSSDSFKRQRDTEELKPFLSKVELAIQRADLEFKKARDPKTDRIPRGIRKQELNFVRNIPTREDVNGFNKSGLPSLQTQTWENAGPFNIAGRMKCLEFDVADEDVILAGAASGGVWKSTNGGDNWVKKFPPHAEQSVYCIEQDKRAGKSNIWYCGTGELLSTTDRKFSTINRTVGIGNGIYKSTDNGETWEHLGSTQIYDESNLSEIFQGVWEIVVDTTVYDEDVVYAACAGAIMKSTDGGGSWTSVLGDLNNKSFSSDIEMSGDGKIFVALSELAVNGERSNKAGVWVSEDGGENFVEITPDDFPENSRVVKIRLAPSNQNVLYLLTEEPGIADNQFYNFASSYHKFWKYEYEEDAAFGEWESRTDNLPYQNAKNPSKSMGRGLNSLGGYCLTFNVHPENEDVIFIGGTNLFRNPDGFSSDSIVKIGGYGADLHPDQHYLAFLPSNPDVMYNCSDGGVTVTSNCFANDIKWTEKNHNLVSGQFYSVDFDRASSDRMMVGGMQDQGTAFRGLIEEDGWGRIFGGDGLDCYIADNKEFIIASIYSGNIFGGSFNQQGYPVFPNYNLLISDNMENNEKFNFYTNFVVEPNTQDILYLAAQNVIWRKNNLKKATSSNEYKNQDWSKISICERPEAEEITALAISENPVNLVFFGTDKGKVYKIEDARSDSPSFSEITGEDFPEGAFVSNVDVASDDADKIIVAFSNYNVQSLFYSTDGGALWEPVGGNLEEHPDGSGAGPSIRWIESLKVEGGKLYFVGTTAGLFSTGELAGQYTYWAREGSDVIGNIRIDMVKARETDNLVAVATQGNGIYTTNAVPPGAEDDKEKFNGAIEIYPNPCVNEALIQFYNPKPERVSIDLFDMNGRKIKRIYSGFKAEGEVKIDASLRDVASGAYIIRIKAGDFVQDKRLNVAK